VCLFFIFLSSNFFIVPSFVIPVLDVLIIPLFPFSLYLFIGLLFADFFPVPFQIHPCLSLISVLAFFNLNY